MDSAGSMGCYPTMSLPSLLFLFRVYETSFEESSGDNNVQTGQFLRDTGPSLGEGIISGVTVRAAIKVSFELVK